MRNKIESQVIEEGDLRAVKVGVSHSGCPNMWNLCVKDASGWYREVQWMSVDNIQPFFKTKLPIYEEVGKVKYKKIG